MVMANLSVSKVARMPHWQLVDAAKELGLQFPPGAMDLEQRAIVARKISGGDTVGMFDQIRKLC